MRQIITVDAVLGTGETKDRVFIGRINKDNKYIVSTYIDYTMKDIALGIIDFMKHYNMDVEVFVEDYGIGKCIYDNLIGELKNIGYGFDISTRKAYKLEKVKETKGLLLADLAGQHGLLMVTTDDDKGQGFGKSYAMHKRLLEDGNLFLVVGNSGMRESICNLCQSQSERLSIINRIFTNSEVLSSKGLGMKKGKKFIVDDYVNLEVMNKLLEQFEFAGGFTSIHALQQKEITLRDMLKEELKQLQGQDLPDNLNSLKVNSITSLLTLLDIEEGRQGLESPDLDRCFK